MKIFQNVIDYSLRLNKGEVVFIFADCESKDYTKQLCEELIEREITPMIIWNDFFINEAFINQKNTNVNSKLFEVLELAINKCDAAVMFDNNIENYDSFSTEDVLIFKNTYYLKVFQKIMKFKRWVYLRYPNEKLANLFYLSYEEHYNLLVRLNNFDYKKLYEKAYKLKQELDVTNKITIIGKGTNLHFFKKNINSVVCCGNINLPDGEVYTAPEKYSVNGTILFDIDTYFRGKTYKNITLKIKDGKVIAFDCNHLEDFGKIINSDEGASYIGEFAFGLNPFITRNYNDNLFNEKMARTIHLALGSAHSDSVNGNESIIHWDLIKNMKQDCSIFFDDNLVFKEGEFIIPELKNMYEV